MLHWGETSTDHYNDNSHMCYACAPVHTQVKHDSTDQLLNDTYWDYS